ncbi:PVC-type heme-binding CxxCH protein [Roseimaritima sediminicola]|uniref:PVC-type heme-binding CxxCH protein n=1 Tax=Roseimaritima sediminicola TaxID=2662066 RepID=UPI0012984E6B|nr:PVC-type heme-binding CxxCH protein [Roseimaritima sediminicola]
MLRNLFYLLFEASARAVATPTRTPRTLLGCMALASALAGLPPTHLTAADDSDGGTRPAEETAAAGESDSAVPSRSVEQVEAALVTADGLAVELAAREPQVVDPIAIRFDAAGRMWVVEMRDYPLPRPDQAPQGRIRVLEDRDADGRFETATTFADGLMFPTGLQPYRNGVIVTLAGKICFFADDDGDLHCDRQEVWFTGFAQQNEQLRANHPVLAADGLVYVAGGLRGGQIRSEDPRWQSDAPLKLTGVDFAFDPRGGFFGPVTGNSQYGLTIDDFGTRIGCSNRNPAIVAVLPYALVERSPRLTPRDALHDAAAVGPNSEVRPIAQAWTTSNLHAGQFSAACGVLRGCGPGMPAAWARDLLICEPTGYLVQRQTTASEHGLLRSRRAEGVEALASRDDWFRPVDLAHGPDGCVYVVDMSRAVIEHPDWMPDELKTRRDMRWGEFQGRIWRLRDAAHQPAAAIAPLEPAAAVRLLGHPNPWHRAVASRLLLERSLSPALVAEVQAVLRSAESTAEAIARAAQFLAYHQRLETADLEHLLQRDDPRLRELALTLVAAEPERWQDAAALARQAANDADPSVRLAAAVLLVLGAETDAPQPDLDALARLAAEDGHQQWFEKVLAAAPPTVAAAVLERLLDRQVKDLPLRFWQTMARQAGRSDADTYSRLLRNAPEDPVRLLALVDGWSGGSQALGEVAGQRLEQARQLAAGVVTDASQPLPLRQLALEQIGAAEQHVAVVRGLLQPSEAAELRRAAVALLVRHDREWALQWLDEELTALPPAVREAAIGALLRDKQTIAWLLDRVQDGRVTMPLVGLNNVDRLKRHSDAEVRKRAAKAFAAAGADRSEVIAKYALALEQRGNAQAGAALFSQHCAACHQVGGVGTNVGPDISDSRTKTKAALLAAVLDPNAAIDAAFLRYSVLTVDGRLLDGLLLSDAGDTVVLQQQGGQRVQLAREEIESISTAGVSLMPEGFEQLLSVEQMRDLLTYVKDWRYQDGSIPLAR